MITIGTFGIPILGAGNYKMMIMAFTTGLAGLISLLFIGGMAGWSETYSTLKNSAWATASILSSHAYIGLQGYSVNTGGTYVFSKYADCSSTTCSDCEVAGQAALGLLIISFFMVVAVTIGSAVRAFKDSEMLKIVMLALSFLIWIFSVAAFGNWNEQCYKAFEDAGIDNLEHDNGYGAAVAGWFFSSFLFLLHLLTPVTATADGSTASSSKASGESPAPAIAVTIDAPPSKV